MEKNNETLSILRHSTSHIMAQAVQSLFPSAKLAIGPATADGFYYDFDLTDGHAFTQEDLAKIEEKMKEIIAEQLSTDADSITEATSFKDDLGADSLDLFELVMALEDEYSVEIPAEDLQNLATVGDVMKYLKDKGVEE